MFSNVSIYTILPLILNDNISYLETTIIPSNNLAISIADLLLRNNYIQGYQSFICNNQYMLRINLRYYKNKPKFSYCQFISRPSRRVCVSVAWLQKKINLMRHVDYLVRTTYGLISAKEAIMLNVGGELICTLR